MEPDQAGLPATLRRLLAIAAGVDGEGYGPIVSAMNTAPAQHSEEIARALSD